MEAWAHQKNIERLEEQLEQEGDATKHRLLEDLLAAERRRLAELRGTSPAPEGRATKG